MYPTAVSVSPGAASHCCIPLKGLLGLFMPRFFLCKAGLELLRCEAVAEGMWR